MRTVLKMAAGISTLAVVSSLAFSPLASAATTVIVTGDTAAAENQPGWLFNRDLSTSSPYEFNLDQSSIGQGSLYVQPIGAAAANKFIAENFINEEVANVDSVSYDFQIGAGGDMTDAGQFYMSVYANFGQSPDDKFYDCRYSVVPTVGSTSGFTTVTFDPTQAYPVTTRGGAAASPFACPPVPADMDLLSPVSTIRAFSLNVGDTSASDTGLDGYLDNVVTSISGDVTVYDFEPALAPVSKADCKQDGWKAFNTPVFKNQGDCVSFIAKKQ